MKKKYIFLSIIITVVVITLVIILSQTGKMKDNKEGYKILTYSDGLQQYAIEIDLNSASEINEEVFYQISDWGKRGDYYYVKDVSLPVIYNNKDINKKAIEAIADYHLELGPNKFSEFELKSLEKEFVDTRYEEWFGLKYEADSALQFLNFSADVEKESAEFVAMYVDTYNVKLYKRSMFFVGEYKLVKDFKIGKPTFEWQPVYYKEDLAE